MKLSRKQIQGTALLLIAGLVFVLPSIPEPTYGYSSTDVNLASAKGYSLVVGGALVVGATPNFSGTASYAGALSGSVASGTYLEVLANGGLANFANNTAAASAALSDVTSVRNLINTFIGTTLAAGEIGGTTFTPGVYDAPPTTALDIGSSITLDGGGNYNSIFIFRTTAAMNIVGSITINCIGGAQPANIYWVAGAALDVGASAVVRGNFIAGAALTTAASSIIYGSVLGLGAVSLGASSTIIHNSIEVDPTITVTPSPSDTSTATATPSPSDIYFLSATPTPKPLVIPLVIELWFTENQSKDGGKLTWSGSNLDHWRFEGAENTYPSPYNYGTFTSGWLGELVNMVPGIPYLMTMEFRSSTGASVTKSITYTIAPAEILIPAPTVTPTPTPISTTAPEILTPIVPCDAVITNLQYIPGPSGSTIGQLTWQTSGTGQVQFFGDVFLYPEIFQYGLFSSQWTGSLINLLPGIRYIVSVNFFADCNRLSGVSTSAMNPVALSTSPATSTPIPTITAMPEESPTPVPAVSAMPSSSPITSTKPTQTPDTIIKKLISDIKRLKNFNWLPNLRNPQTGQDSIHIILHNLIPGQEITINLRQVEK
jgi:hypothetical protein